MSAMSDASPPFGTYSLSGWREQVRLAADNVPTSRVGMWMVSCLRKISLFGHVTGIDGPLDVDVAKNVRTRLFPSSNRCEKRAYAGVHIWDGRERGCLHQAIAEATGERPFVFMDIGANVGLYSLFANASAKELGKPITIVAVEPDTENRKRLTFNLAASGCDASVEPIGISDRPGSGVLTSGGGNRGGIAIVDDGEGTSVPLETLAQLIERYGFQTVDAMKVDIEGRDQAALRALMEQAPRTIWPKLLIVEVGHRTDSPIVRQMTDYGYELRERVGINAIMRIGDPVSSPASPGKSKV